MDVVKHAHAGREGRYAMFHGGHARYQAKAHLNRGVCHVRRPIKFAKLGANWRIGFGASCSHRLDSDYLLTNSTGKGVTPKCSPISNGDL